VGRVFPIRGPIFSGSCMHCARCADTCTLLHLLSTSQLVGRWQGDSGVSVKSYRSLVSACMPGVVPLHSALLLTIFAPHYTT
jgi:hypothetical protein